jgi:hypothetical protein
VIPLSTPRPCSWFFVGIVAPEFPSDRGIQGSFSILVLGFGRAAVAAVYHIVDWSFEAALGAEEK